MEPLWIWLNTTPAAGEVLNPFGAVYLVVFAIGFLISAYFAGPGAQRVLYNPVQQAGIGHWATVGLWVFGLGLFFFGIRAMQFNPLSFGEPIWLVASVVAAIVAAARCVDWWRTTYPLEVARHAPENAPVFRLDPALAADTAPARPTRGTSTGP